MAPKKHEPPPPPPEDVNPIGVFVSVTIPAATVVLDIPADAAQDPASQRKTHITLNLPGCHVPWASPPIAPSEGNIYQYSIVKHFRRSGGQDGLVQLINGNIAVTIHDSATNAALASGTIDQMWGFAIGQNTWSADGYELTPAAEVPPGVPKALSAQLSFVSLALQERQLPPGADAAALAAAPPPESELPPLLPYSYVTPEFTASGNMVELVVNDLSPLPQQLHTAHELAGGKVSLAVGVRIPGGPSVVVQAALQGGQLVMPALRREQLTAEACTAFQYHLEDGLPIVLEVARYVTAEHFNDPAWEAYHAAVPASNLFKVLMSAGGTQGAAEGLALEAYSTVVAAQGITKSSLPPYMPPSSKSKPIEDAPPQGTCHWEKLGARVSVSFRLARPLIPPWQPPPPPPRSLLEMIPPRDLTPKPPPTTAADEFKGKVRSIARALAEEYKAVLPALGDTAGGGGADSRHKALVFELNRSGKYAQMRDSLKTAVVALVREKYRKSGSMSPNEMALLYNDLYGTLLAAVHSALNDMIDAAAARPRQPLPDPVPDKQRLEQLLDLAGQAEALGDNNRAEALHQRRLLAKTDPQVWYEYGTFCLRRGARGRAEQAFREALSLSPTHRPALLALLGCSVAEGRATDAAYLEAAEAAAHRLMEVAGEGAEAEPMAQWAVMALVYKAFGDSKRTELSSCEQEMSRLEQETLGELAAANPTPTANGPSPTAKSPSPISPAPSGTPHGVPTAPSTPSAPRTASPRSSAPTGTGASPSNTGHRNTNTSVDGGESGSTAAGGAGYGGHLGGPVVGELQSRAFISLANTLLETLSLPSEALLALELAASQRHWSTMAPDTRCAHSLAVCLGQQALAEEPGAGPEARAGGEALLAPASALVGLIRGGGAPAVRARLVAAQMYRRWGQTELAIRFYQEYLDALRPAGRLSEVALSVWLQLAGCYIARGQHRHAADVYLAGAAQKPGCAALWRGAGEALLAEGDLSGADMALSEANVLDPEDPVAWGWLALVAVREGRKDDGEKALSFALRCGLEEPAVLLQLADEYGSLGQLRQQQRVLQELAHRLLPDSCNMRLRLVRCLAAQHMGPEAAVELQAARQLAGTEEDEAAVAELAEQLRSG